jgi:hypothetical protein
VAGVGGVTVQCGVGGVTVQCRELLFPCLRVLADVVWQTLIVGGGHITVSSNVSSNVWWSGLAARAWGVY